jgi:hypothetical protein
MKNQKKAINLNSFKYDEEKYKNDPDYKNSILYAFATIQSF